MEYTPAEFVSNFTLAQVVGRWHSVLRQRAFWKVILADGTEIGEWEGEVRDKGVLDRIDEEIYKVRRHLNGLSPLNPDHMPAIQHFLVREAELQRQRNSIGLVDWSRLPHDRIRQALLIAPSGEFIRFRRNEGGLFFQLKMATVASGYPGTGTDAHVLGAVYDLDGDAEVGVYDAAGLHLGRGTVHNLRVHGTPIANLYGPHVGIPRVPGIAT